MLPGEPSLLVDASIPVYFAVVPCVAWRGGRRSPPQSNRADATWIGAPRARLGGHSGSYSRLQVHTRPRARAMADRLDLLAPGGAGSTIGAPVCGDRLDAGPAMVAGPELFARLPGPDLQRVPGVAAARAAGGARASRELGGPSRAPDRRGRVAPRQSRA